jgi:hypothetical protein
MATGGVNPVTVAHDEDESVDPVYFVRPSDNVWSYFTFIAPTEAKKAEKTGSSPYSWDVVMAYALVSMTFFMQAVLIYLVFQEVVLSNVEWQNGIFAVGNKGVPTLFGEAPGGGKCNSAASLCFTDRGNFTCAPPSIQLSGRWEDLDTNKDGVWTREEVEASKEALQCRYAVNPVEVFDVMINMIKKREHLIWIHPDIHAAKAIHFAYFQYAIGDITMCGYRAEQMCPNLLRRGFFDSAFIHGTAPRVGKTTETAMAYCRKLLRPQGLCEELLPSTYTVWKIASGIECGGEDYSKFKYTNPGTKLTKSLLEVDYGSRQEYELAQDGWFRIFKGIVLIVWSLIMFNEYKEIVKFISLVLYFPDATDFGEDYVLVEQDPSDPEDVRYRLQGIHYTHRVHVGILCCLRLGLTTFLCVVGMSYIIKTNVYPDLLMNVVALAFVAEIASVLYSQILREEIRDQTEDIKAIKVPMFGIRALNQYPALLDIILLAFVIGICYAIMEWQMGAIVQPIYQALECTCLSRGSECYESNRFDNKFWNNYWYRTVPWIYEEVAKLKAALPAGAASYVAAQAGSIVAGQTPEPQVDVSVVKQADVTVTQMEASNKNLFSRLKTIEQEIHDQEDSTSSALIQKRRTNGRNVVKVL